MKLTGRQQDIIETSVRLIAERGIQQLTIKNIAAELKISEPAIYRHFVSKFAILNAVLDSFENIAQSVLDELPVDDMDPLDGIEVFILDRLERMAANPPLAKVMFSEELFQDDQRLADKVLAIMHAHKHRIEQFILRGRESGRIRCDIEPVLLFRLIFGPIRLLIKQWALSGYRFNLCAEGMKQWRVFRELIEVAGKSPGNIE